MLLTDDNKHQVILGCINQERKAQEQLYKSFYVAMMSLCQRFTKNEQDALSILNNGFLKVFRNIAKYESEKASLYTWIRTIVLNTCLDFIKLAKTDFTTTEIDSDTDYNTKADVIEKYNSEEILAHIRKLPAATKAVFNLYVIEGYNHKEIGTILNISEGTSKWHLSDARKKLQQILNTTTI